MRNIVKLAALLILAVPSPALSDTKVTEMPDHVVIEITGPPPSPQEVAARERRQRRSELESAIQRLVSKRLDLGRKGTPEGSKESEQERRALLVEKRRELDKLQDELRELNSSEETAGKPPTPE